MIQNVKYDLFSRDASCVFAIVENNGKLEKAYPCNNRYEWPRNDAWIESSPFFIQEDGRIDTNVSLAGKPSSISLMAKFSLDEKQLSSLPITKLQASSEFSGNENVDFSKCRYHLFKEGTDNINGVLNAYALAARCTDGTLLKLVFKVYFERTSTINSQEFSYVVEDDSFIDKPAMVFFTLDSSDLFAELYINDKLKKSFGVDLVRSLGLSFNTPFNRSVENMTLSIADAKKALHLKSAVVLNRYSNYQYVKNAFTTVS